MRIEVTERKLYKFSELSDDAKQKALKKLAFINADHDWWEYTYDDAKNIGLKITEFDIYSNTIDGELTLDAIDVCKKILADHGDKCDTHKTAASALPELLAQQAIIDDDSIPDTAESDTKIAEAEEKLEELTEEFEQAILEDYLSILKKEFEYLTSEKAIIETIEANDYEFTEKGVLS